MQFESQIETPGNMLSARSIKYADKNQTFDQHYACEIRAPVSFSQLISHIK